MGTKSFRIMIVDDEPDIRTLLSVALTHQYEVFEASNGLDAMLKLEKYEPDLAIIDIMMPLMNGMELIKKIRETPPMKDLPIIALSALNSTEDIKRGYSAGANLYLTKPFQPDRVVKNVEFNLKNATPRPKTLTMAEIREREHRHAEQLKRALSQKPGQRYQTSSMPKLEIPPKSPPSPPVPPAPAPKPMTEDRPARPATDSEEFNDLIAKSPVLKSHRSPKPGIDTPSISPVMPSGPRPRILLVDDDEDFLTIQRTILEEHYEVVTATDGLDALNKIPEVEPDLYIIDGMMPKMSGYQLIDMIHGALETRGKPIIFASAKGSPRDKRMMEQKGVYKYLVKPFDSKTLLDAVHDIVHSAGFRVSGKKQDIGDILYREGKRRAEVASTTDMKKRWKSYGKLENFLKSNKQRDPFDKEITTSDEEEW